MIVTVPSAPRMRGKGARWHIKGWDEDASEGVFHRLGDHGRGTGPGVEEMATFACAAGLA